MSALEPIRNIGNTLLVSSRNRRQKYHFDDPLKAFKNLIAHASQNCPYYVEMLSKYKVLKDGEVDLDAFRRLPTLSKDILNKRLDDLMSTDKDERNWHYNHSGGSTGEPTRFAHDHMYDILKEQVLYYYFNEILDMDYLKTKKVIIWGSQNDILRQEEGLRKKIVNWLEKAVYLNCFEISTQNIIQYINTINAVRPQLVRGYATGVYELSRYIIENNVKVAKPALVILQAENVTDEMRETVQKAFGAPVRDLYGSREVSCIAGEGDDGLLHTFPFWNYVEILDENNNPVQEGEEGRVVVTNLCNYAMPLIRYEIGDRAIRGPMVERDGILTPTLKRITGRVTDSFIKRDGTIIPAEFFIHFIGVVCNDGAIKKFQLIQEDYEQIKILFVSEGELSKEQKSNIEDKIMRVMGDDCQIIWEQVPGITKTKEGKYLFTKSMVKR